MALRLRRGTDAERQLITPDSGELIFTTDTNLVYVGDGNTQGGLPIGGTGGGLGELVNDASPQLGGSLDLNSNEISGVGNINIDGTIDANSITTDAVSSTLVSTSTLEADSAVVNGITNPTHGVIYNESNNSLTLDEVIASQVTADNISLSTLTDANGSLLWDTRTSILYAEDVAVRRLVGYDSTLIYDHELGAMITDSLLVDGIFRTDQLQIYRGDDNTILVDSVETDLLYVAGSINTPDSSVFFDVGTNSMTVSSGTFDEITTLQMSSSSGVLTVGGETPTRLLARYDGTGSPLSTETLAENSNFIELGTSNGTLDAPTVLTGNDSVSGLILNGYDGTDYNRCIAIAGIVDPNGGVAPGSISGKLLIVAGNATNDGDVQASFDSRGTFAAPVIQPGTYADATARDAFITSPAAGMMVFLTDGGAGTPKFQGYDGTAWVDLN